MNRSTVVLSYEESLLRESDIELLTGPHWLNDSIISFYFEFLQVEKFRNNKSILFVPPDVTQCMKISPQNDMKIFLDPLLQEANRKFIFLALNDNELTEYSGGTHWSLLVFSKPERMVFHYDSLSGSNESQAVDLAEKLLRYFSLPIQGKYEEANCLQQNNGYDCGIHVLCNTEQLASYANYYGKIRGCPKLDFDTVRGKRREILSIIGKLKSRTR